MDLQGKRCLPWNVLVLGSTLSSFLVCSSKIFLAHVLQVMAFVEALGTRKVTASIRQTRGLDANAACGQLRNDFQKIPIPVAA